MAQNPKRGNTAVIVVLTVLIVLMIAATAFLIYLSINLVNKEADVTPTGSTVQLPQTTQTKPVPTETEEPEAPTTEAPETEQVIATATIGAMGDLLMHEPVFRTCRQSDGSYDFSSIFRYIKDAVSTLDYAIANLETTFGGDNYPYQGNPAFNCPDPLIDAVKDAGFDMLLTANNHAGDTMNDGIQRTIEIVRDAGLATLGSQLSGENRYSVVEVNGIKIGMVNYTYQGQPDNPTPGKVYMNKNTLSDLCGTLVNSFVASQPDAFYLDARQCLEEMKAAGAEAAVMFIHWGNEYQTTPDASQRQMAQQLCDLGYDVIVGGHPHVIQPMELLTSRLDPEHKTVCLYSTGNAVSNQRISEMDLKTGHTEDALLFQFTFSKYSDGRVYLESADILPCWVDLRTEPQKEYPIIPLDEDLRDQWQSLYELTDESLTNAQKSLDRTKALTDPGLLTVQSYLEQQKQQREADYLAAVTEDRNQAA